MSAESVAPEWAYRDPGGQQMDAWYARPEDVIAGKLMAWAESRRHEDDIYSMLVFIYMEADADVTATFDEVDAYADTFAASLGPDVAELWADLKAAAAEDAQGDD